MYEQYFANFSFVDENSPFCIIRLNDPYAGVEVIIAKTFVVTPENELKFDYEVVKVPEEINKGVVNTIEFIDLVKNVFMAILEDEMNQYAEPEPPAAAGEKNE
jgi:hypothetical protein